MKVAFVLPPYNYSSSVGIKKDAPNLGLLPPLGVGCLAAAVESRGCGVVLVDAVAEQLTVEETAAAVAAHAPDVVGISSLTTQSTNPAYALAAAIRQALPGIPIVMGGPHVTAFARRIHAECPDIDILVPGDGEMVLAELVERMSKNQDWRDVRGILYRSPSGETVCNPPAELVANLDAFPHPARHIYKHELYRPLPSLSLVTPATSIITSRGCPWARCRFCYQGGEFAAPYRRRSPEDVMAEIRALKADWGIRNLVFWDDNFCCMPEWVDRFCELMKAEQSGIIWSVLSRVDTVSPEMFRKMAEAGCYSVQFGFESGNQQILNLIRKGATLNQARQAVRWAREAGLDIRGFFVLGFPTETPEMSQETVQFACELNIDYVIFFSYHIQPGTELEPIALEHGCPGEYQGMQAASYLPATYASAEELNNAVRDAYRRYYFRPAYMARALMRLAKKPSLIKNHLMGFRYWWSLTRAPDS